MILKCLFEMESVWVKNLKRQEKGLEILKRLRKAGNLFKKQATGYNRLRSKLWVIPFEKIDG
jgi:hypothetical protein